MVQQQQLRQRCFALFHQSTEIQQLRFGSTVSGASQQTICGFQDIATLLRLLLTVVSVFAVSPSLLWGCPFCTAMEGETLLSDVDRAKAVVLGTPIAVRTFPN